MLPVRIRKIVRKLLVLSILTTCLIVVNSDSGIEKARAAACCSTCDPYYRGCLNYCGICGCNQQLCIWQCGNGYNSCRSTCDPAC